MSNNDSTAADHVHHMQKMLNLNIDPSWYNSIISHFSAVENAADQMMTLALPAHTESAMVYQLPKVAPTES